MYAHALEPLAKYQYVKEITLAITGVPPVFPPKATPQKTRPASRGRRRARGAVRCGALEW